MLGLFGSRTQNNKIIPDTPFLKGQKKYGRIFKLPETTPYSQLWNFFLTEQYDTYETLKNRKNRYVDLDFAVKNSPLIQMSADLYADEATQCDVQGEPIRIKAASVIQNDIRELLDRWNINQQTVRECIWNKVVFGDAFDINEIDEREGIIGVQQVSVWDIEDRLEFDPSKLLEQLKFFSNNWGSNNAAKLQALFSDLEKSGGNPAAYFKKFLLGFELKGGQMVAPWSVTHYRAYSMLREFAPWGRSQFVNVLPAYRQLMSAEGLMSVARASVFPRDLYMVAAEPGSTPAEKWESMEEFGEQLDNAGLEDGSKEMPSIGTRIIIPKDLAEFTQLDNSLDLDKIADVDYLRDNLIMGLSIPKGYLIVDQGGWGTSGQALLQQFKPFGRKVFSHQSDYLTGLIEKIKLHYAITGKFDGWDTAFELQMDFPVIEESSERTQHKAEELTLAKDTIETLKDVLGVDIVPPEIVKDALGFMTSLPAEKVDYYVNQLMKANEEQKPVEGEGEDPLDNFNSVSSAFGEKKRQYYEKAHNRFYETSIRDLLLDSSFQIKEKLQLTEGIDNGVHYKSSLKSSTDQKHMKFLMDAFSIADPKRKYLTEEFRLQK